MSVVEGFFGWLLDVICGIYVLFEAFSIGIGSLITICADDATSSGVVLAIVAERNSRS
jgi:cytochrome bd-type quinol oxidase subunit 2